MGGEHKPHDILHSSTIWHARQNDGPSVLVQLPLVHVPSSMHTCGSQFSWSLLGLMNAEQVNHGLSAHVPSGTTLLHMVKAEEAAAIVEVARARQHGEVGGAAPQPQRDKYE